MNRRRFLGRLGLIGAAVGGGWWLKDNVLWRKPDMVFPAEASWIGFDEPRAILPTVRVEIGGQSVRALIDSGAQYSVIDRGLLETLGLKSGFDVPMVAYGVGGNPQVGRGITLDVTVGGIEVRNLRTAILALGPLAMRDGLSASLILGQDTLSRAQLIVEEPLRRLRLVPTGTSSPQGLVTLPVARSGTSLTHLVQIEGTTVKAVVDTGASALIAVTQSTAKAVGLIDGRPQAVGATVVLGGTTQSMLVRSRHIRIGADHYEDVETPIYADVTLPGFPQALMGMRAFEGRTLLMDISAEILMISPQQEITVINRQG